MRQADSVLNWLCILVTHYDKQSPTVNTNVPLLKLHSGLLQRISCNTPKQPLVSQASQENIKMIIK